MANLPEESEPTPGIYRHYRGGLYEVLFVAKHSETEEELVIYRSLHGTSNSPNKYWARPRKMFLEAVSTNGIVVERFVRVPPQIEA